MRSASRSTILWFVCFVGVYIALWAGLNSRIPRRLICSAEDFVYSSIFALVATFCVLVGSAGFLSFRRDEQPLEIGRAHV